MWRAVGGIISIETNLEISALGSLLQVASRKNL
jgi:hypothetical protein